MGDDVHRDREDDGGVLLSRDRVQGLEVAELEKNNKRNTHDTFPKKLKKVFFKKYL